MTKSKFELEFHPNNLEGTLLLENEINNILEKGHYISGFLDNSGNVSIQLDELNFKSEIEIIDDKKHINFVPLEKGEEIQERIILKNGYVLETKEKEKTLIRNGYSIYDTTSLPMVKTEIIIYRYSKLNDRK